MDEGAKSSKEESSEPPMGLLGEFQLASNSSSRASTLFGIETRLEQLIEKLDLESEEVTLFIAVVGMRGIGKTTLAKKLLEKCRSKFVHAMFLDDVREKSQLKRYRKLEKELLKGLKKSKNDETENKYTVSTRESLKAELRKSKVFIVLDDVSEKSQIDGILGGRDWLRAGSRVVITTSNMSAVKDNVNEIYLVPGLSDNEAFEYFEDQTFPSSCKPRFMKLAREFVNYSRGHPLALKELCEDLILKKDEAYWESKLGTLAKSPISDKIQEVLKIPYDDLNEHHKDLFMDVACFFRFHDENHVTSLLDSSVDENRSDIREFADKFLINICGGRLEMNDLMYTCAMRIIPQSYTENSTSGRRLFNHGEIISTLRTKTDAKTVRGMFLDMSEVPEMSLCSDTFEDMEKLRYLKFFDSSCPKEEVGCKLTFRNGLDFTLKEIRYLHWLKYPRKKLPRNFDPHNLIDLQLPYSRIEKVWDEEKDTSKLKWLDLNHSRKLSTLSGLSRARKLQSMNLEGCTELKEVHEWLQNMESLVFLNLRGCTSLKSLPQMSLISLKTLILSGCSSLEQFNLVSKNLEELYLDGTAIKELPSDIGNLQRLVLLILKDCKALLRLPDSIGKLKALQKLVLSGCVKLESFPEVKETMKQLQTLLLDGTAIKEMPDLLDRLNVTSSWSNYNFRDWPHGFSGLSSVQRLCLSNNKFRSLPSSISCLYHLKWLNLKNCMQLRDLPVLPPNLQWLNAHGCVSLEKIESSLARMLAETEQSHSTFIFTNCTKLDQVAKNDMVSYVRRKIQLMSNALAHQEKGSVLDVLIGICYPGWHLPIWFNYRSCGSELKQNLPQHWNENGLTGIALCAVISYKVDQGQNKDSETQIKDNQAQKKDNVSLNKDDPAQYLRCTSMFEEKDKTPVEFSCILGGWTEHGDARTRNANKSSGHVFIGYTSLSDIKKHYKGVECVATQASFKFEVTDGTKQITNCEVLKCGFTLIYAPTKPVNSLCTEKHSDHDEKRPASTTDPGGNIKGAENYYISAGTADGSSEEGEDEVINVEFPQREESVHEVNTRKEDTEEPGNEESPDGTKNLLDEESLEEKDIVQGVNTMKEEREEPGNDQTLTDGVNNLFEIMEKPLRVICLVISIYTVATFVMRKR